VERCRSRKRYAGEGVRRAGRQGWWRSEADAEGGPNYQRRSGCGSRIPTWARYTCCRPGVLPTYRNGCRRREAVQAFCSLPQTGWAEDPRLGLA
jgi:hypothetical protein